MKWTWNTPDALYRRSLIAVAAACLVAGSTAQEQRIVAETYGAASGDLPMQGLGLVLELVEAGTPDARLRLSGGLPGHVASIHVSDARSETAASASNGATALLGATLLAFEGTFDWAGNYEVSIDDLGALPAGTRLYAQGIHTGQLEFGAGGPLTQVSHGLELVQTTERGEATPFDDLLPHLPEERRLKGAETLAERLQDMLDSAGDSARLALEGGLTIGLGIEVIDAKAGGNVALEFTVERTPEGLYEVIVAADTAALVGVGVGLGAEAGAEAAAGSGVSYVFRFHSAPGAARGITGMVLWAAVPVLQPGRFLNEHGALFGDPAEHLATLRASAKAAGETAQRLERVLWDVLEREVADARSARKQARKQLKRAQKRLANASLAKRPRAAADVAARQAIVIASETRLQAAQAAFVQGRAALEAARAELSERNDALNAVLEGVARVARLAAAVTQARTFTLAHCSGSEMRFASSLEAEAKLQVPFVTIENVGAGAAGAASRGVIARSELATDEHPYRLSVTQLFEVESVLWGGLVGAAELTRTKTLAVTDTFELDGLESRWAEKTVSVTDDTCAVYGAGFLLARETGIGRTRSYSYHQSDVFRKVIDMASVLRGEGLPDSAGSATFGLELQDRREQNVDFAFGLEINGSGGSVQMEIEWDDQGRAQSRSTSVREGVEAIAGGPGQVIDAINGSVRTIE